MPGNRSEFLLSTIISEIMNYAKSVASLSDKQYYVENIQSQAELEIGRRLNATEENLLFSRFSAQQLHGQILKVW